VLRPSVFAGEFIEHRFLYAGLVEQIPLFTQFA
jgi:hypothetical protein